VINDFFFARPLITFDLPQIESKWNLDRRLGLAAFLLGGRKQRKSSQMINNKKLTIGRGKERNTPSM
jgi:hypothetical protein